MKFHPFAEVFPKLADAELRELADDIKAHGQQEKIWTYKGQILDGRNRFNACVLAGVKAQFRPFKGSETEALAFVVSANIKRRHLTTEQLALAAARIATLREGANQHLPKNKGSDDEPASREAPSQAEAAEQFGVSRSSVQRARKVVEQGSAALQKAVEKGEVPLAKAAAVVDLPKSEQLAAAKNAPQKQSAEAETQKDAAPERPDDIDEDAALAAAEAEMGRTFDRLLKGDTDAKREIERLTKLVGTLESSRDGYMRGKEAVMKLLKAEQRKTAQLSKRVKQLEDENAKLSERLGKAA